MKRGPGLYVWKFDALYMLPADHPRHRRPWFVTTRTSGEPILYCRTGAEAIEAAAAIIDGVAHLSEPGEVPC